MKQLHDFVFCDGAFHADVVFYLVRVGNSVMERRAHNWLKQLTQAKPCYLYTIHTQEMVNFKEKVAASVFNRPSCPIMRPALLLRQTVVDVLWLARFLRHNPPELLNSTRINTPVDYNILTMSGLIDAADYQMRKTSARKKSFPIPKRKKTSSYHGENKA